MTRGGAPQRGRGFSLVELSISLAVTGLLGYALWSALPRTDSGRQLTHDEVRQTQTVTAAIDGFVLQNHRLPCPDAAAQPSGVENCASGLSTGWLPWAALGLDAQQGWGVKYAVRRVTDADPAQDTDLARALNRQIPGLPTGYLTSTAPNGLDVCHALRTAGANPGKTGALTVGGAEAAYALAFAGRDRQFQGLNATAFESPLRTKAAGYDDTVLAMGVFEFAGRLGCVQRLGLANASARAALAAEDMDRNAAFMAEFRTFSRELRQTDLNFAIATLALATLDLINATATSITAVAIAGNSAGIGAGVVIPAVLAVGATAAALVAATASVATSTLAVQEAQKKESEAQRLRAESALLLIQSAAEAVAQDQKGLQP